MKVFITGGTGFLGANLALRHAELGDQVVVLSKEATDVEQENARDLRQVGVEVIRGSITDRSLLENGCQSTDRIYHIAAAMREANISDQVFWDVNVEATRQLLEFARDADVKRFVYCSSIGAMGKSMQKPADENTPCNPKDIYQVTKRAAEQLCLEFHQEHGFPLSIVRPADVYGPRDRRYVKLFKGIKKGRFALIGNGKNEHHMVYIDDMVQGFLLAAECESAIGEIFIIAGERPVQVREFVNLVAKEIGSPPPKLKIPLFPAQTAAVIVEKICKPFGIQPPLYPRRVDFFRTDYAFDISKAKRMLGYQPQIDLQEGVRRTYQWYERQGLMGAKKDGSRHEFAATANRPVPVPGEMRDGSTLRGPLEVKLGNPIRSGVFDTEVELSAKIEEFDTFWEGPEDVEKGFASFGQFYRANYLEYVPPEKDINILVICCGPGYFVNLLREEDYSNVLGIDSDPEKVKYAIDKGLNCRSERAFPFLARTEDIYDMIFVEQEINHLTKEEIIEFLRLCRSRLREEGTLIVHSLNGANPITGAEALAQNFDHFNTFTDYSLRQVIGYSGFGDIHVIPLNLYVFYNNPFNYVAMVAAGLLSLFFRFSFKLYGKHNKIFTKKIAAVSRKKPDLMSSRDVTGH
jgi:nucleoside-diphosphate-sugar epimerase/2-polyprenyl-3-methyl-5-hydroxy-6-metoxy-1,4-benzoquinol methylase